MQFGNVYITINFNIAYCQKIREVQETEKKNEIWSNFDDHGTYKHKRWKANLLFHVINPLIPVQSIDGIDVMRFKNKGERLKNVIQAARGGGFNNGLASRLDLVPVGKMWHSIIVGKLGGYFDCFFSAIVAFATAAGLNFDQRRLCLHIVFTRSTSSCRVIMWTE